MWPQVGRHNTKFCENLLIGSKVIREELDTIIIITHKKRTKCSQNKIISRKQGETYISICLLNYNLIETRVRNTEYLFY